MATHCESSFLLGRYLRTRLRRCWLIKRILRWRGDESLEIYARVSDQEWSSRSSAAIGALVDASLVPRLPQIEFSEDQETAFRHMAHALI